MVSRHFRTLPEDLTSQTFLDFQPRTRKILYAILIVAFFLRLSSILSLRITPSSDALEFHLLAKSLIEGSRYSLNGVPTAYRAPGYPYFLALIYWISDNSIVTAQIVQALLETFQCALLYFLGIELFSPAVGIVAAGFWAAYPVSVIQSNLLMSEPLFGCLFLGSVVLIFSRHFSSTIGLISIGSLWGWLTLIKPFFVLAPVILAIWMLWRKRALKQTLRICFMTFLVMSLVIAPWIIRNITVFRTPMITSNSGVNLWIGNNPTATGGWRFDPASSPLSRTSDEMERNRLGTALAWRFVTSKPVAFLFLIPKKIAYLFSSESPLAVHLAHRSPINPQKSYASLYLNTPLLLHLGINVHYVYFMMTGLLGLLFVPANRKYDAGLFLLLILLWIGVHAIYFGNHRFHYPLMPFFVLCSAYATLHFNDLRLQGSGARLLLYSLLVIGFLAILIAEVLTALAHSHA